ncbi:hypothetical protein ACN2WE_04885 [Streptomyces sp. cg28]|uniref:hypothetical protein n=1 Tax=Streptomyces sp. cg28 TaxID=3403457 RepID=UPI003B20E75D
MAFHEQRPWVEPQRQSRIHGHVIIGATIALALFIVCAVMDLSVAAIIAGLAIFTAIVLAVGNWVSQRRDRRP